MPKCAVCKEEEVWASHDLYRVLEVCGRECAMREFRRMRQEIEALKSQPGRCPRA